MRAGEFTDKNVIMTREGNDILSNCRYFLYLVLLFRFEQSPWEIEILLHNTTEAVQTLRKFSGFDNAFKLCHKINRIETELL